MSLWAFGNILCVSPLQFAYVVHPCFCISVWDGGLDISGLSIFYLTLFLVCWFFVVFLGFLAGCSCTNVW